MALQKEQSQIFGKFVPSGRPAPSFDGFVSDMKEPFDFVALRRFGDFFRQQQTAAIRGESGTFNLAEFEKQGGT